MRIVAERRFRVHIRGSSAGWWDVFWHRVDDFFGALIRAFSHSVPVAPGVSAALGDLLIIAAAAAVLVFGVRLALRSAREYGRAAPLDPAVRELSARALYSAALRAASTGSYAAAIVLLFRSALAAMEMQHVLDDVPSRTVNEWRREVRRSAPALSGAFDSIASAFTSVAYAGSPATETQWKNARDAFADSFGRTIDREA